MRAKTSRARWRDLVLALGLLATGAGCNQSSGVVDGELSGQRPQGRAPETGGFEKLHHVSSQFRIDGRAQSGSGSLGSQSSAQGREK